MNTLIPNRPYYEMFTILSQDYPTPKTKNTINIYYVLLCVLLIFRDYVEICNSSVDGFTQHVSYYLLHH